MSVLNSSHGVSPGGVGSGVVLSKYMAGGAEEDDGMGDGSGQRSAAQLYVGDLGKDVNERDIYDAFSSTVDIQSIRIPTDHQTGESLGYAYVNFSSVKEAEKAYNLYNVSTICNRPCRVLFVDRDPSRRKNNQANLLIKNVSKTVTNRDLHDLFSLYGDVQSLKLETDHDGVNTGMAFVNFSIMEEAETAIKNVNNQELGGKKLIVVKFIPKSEREGANGENYLTPKFYTNVYIRGYPATMEESAIRSLLAQYGNINSLHIKPPVDGFSCTMCNYDDSKDAQRCVAELNGKKVHVNGTIVEQVSKDSDEGDKNDKEAESKADSNTFIITANPCQDKFRRRQAIEEQKRLEQANASGRNGNLDHAGIYSNVNKQRQNDDCTLYIRNLPTTYTKEDLISLLEAYGDVVSASMQFKNGINMGVGIAQLSNPEEAQHALSDLQKNPKLGKPLHVSFFEKKSDRAARIANVHKIGGGAAIGQGGPAGTQQAGNVSNNMNMHNLHNNANMGMGGGIGAIQSMPGPHHGQLMQQPGFGNNMMNHVQPGQMPVGGMMYNANLYRNVGNNLPNNMVGNQNNMQNVMRQGQPVMPVGYPYGSDIQENISNQPPFGYNPMQGNRQANMGMVMGSTQNQSQPNTLQYHSVNQYVGNNNLYEEPADGHANVGQPPIGNNENRKSRHNRYHNRNAATNNANSVVNDIQHIINTYQNVMKSAKIIQETYTKEQMQMFILQILNKDSVPHAEQIVGMLQIVEADDLAKCCTHPETLNDFVQDCTHTINNQIDKQKREI